MCGIVGYIGYREAYPIVIKGLKRLEYRGYDSAGVMLFDGASLKLCKTKGKVSDLEAKAAAEITTNGTIGMGHTRWATHGVPNDVNSHPHLSNSGDLAIIHNGIIENYAPLLDVDLGCGDTNISVFFANKVYILIFEDLFLSGKPSIY